MKTAEHIVIVFAVISLSHERSFDTMLGQDYLNEFPTSSTTLQNLALHWKAKVFTQNLSPEQRTEKIFTFPINPMN